MGKKKMSRKEAMKKFKDILVQRRDLIRAELNSETDAISSQTRSVMSDDISALAQEAEQEEINFHIVEASSRELAQTIEAIERIGSGEYGNCVDCEEEIALARLEAIPFTTRCLKCQRQFEIDGERNNVSDEDDD